jgi:hypothetical protein
MSYTISIAPSTKPGQVTATSSDGHSLTTTTSLLDTARYWLNHGAKTQRNDHHHLVIRIKPLGVAQHHR